MDSAEIVYATVDEIIGKTGKLPHELTLFFHVQAPEEVLHKLRLASSALKTEPSSETLRDPSERVMSSLFSSPNVKPEDSVEQWALQLIFRNEHLAAAISSLPTETETLGLNVRTARAYDYLY